jgi:hypothetical protein
MLKLITILLLCTLSVLVVGVVDDVKINHAVIAVKNLASAVKNFEDVGFTVVKTGQFGGNFVHNAHIQFSDDSYIELFAPVKESSWQQFSKLRKEGKLDDVLKSQNIMDKRFLEHLSTTEGLVDFALEMTGKENIADFVKRVNASGIMKYEGPISMKRIKPDGKVIKWQVYVPHTDELPFLIYWETKEKFYSSEVAQKKLGLLGIEGITIAVKDLETSINKYQVLLNMNAVPVKCTIINTKEVCFALKYNTINLIYAENDKSPVYQYCKEHGYGPYSLILKTDLKKDIKS